MNWQEISNSLIRLINNHLRVCTGIETHVATQTRYKEQWIITWLTHVELIADDFISANAALFSHQRPAAHCWAYHSKSIGQCACMSYLYTVPVRHTSRQYLYTVPVQVWSLYDVPVHSICTPHVTPCLYIVFVHLYVPVQVRYLYDILVHRICTPHHTLRHTCLAVLVYHTCMSDPCTTHVHCLTGG